MQFQKNVRVLIHGYHTVPLNALQAAHRGGHHRLNPLTTSLCIIWVCDLKAILTGLALLCPHAKPQLPVCFTRFSTCFTHKIQEIKAAGESSSGTSKLQDCLFKKKSSG